MTFIIEPWVLYGLGAAILAALLPLTQEHGKADPLALACAVKITVALSLLPLIALQGLPTDPRFYAGLAITSVMWCISDVYYYNAVRTVGAGPVSRLLAGMAVPGFILWLIVNPSLIDTYAATPWRSVGIIGCIVGSAIFASRLSHCAVTRQTLKLLWFVCLSAIVAPTAAKLILTSAGTAKAPFAYGFVEALMMLSLWTLYGLARRGRGRAIVTGLKSPALLRTGLLIGLINASCNILEHFGMMQAEHPSYINVLVYTDVLWIVLIYRLIGRRETAKVGPGLGLAACAALLVLLKSI